MATEVFDLLGRVSADVSPFNSAFDSSAKSVDQNLAAMYQSARNWLGAGGVAGVFGKAASEANQFGQIIADIASITDLQIKGVEKSLKRLDNVFGPPSRSGQTFYETISSGVRGSTDEVAKYVEAVGKTATTIRADIENTGNAMTTITNAYGKGINDTQSLLDFFYLTVREGKAHGDELARTLGLVVNNASEAGVSLHELGSAIAILSRTQSASQSMIGLNQLLNSLIKPTLQAQAEAKKWGIEMGASALQAKGLTATLRDLHERVGGNVEALEKMFGNIRAGRAILSLTGKQFDNFIDTLTAFEMGAGTGEAAFTKQIDTAYKDLIRLRAQTEKTLIQIGQDVEPVTRTFYNLSEAVMKGFTDTSALSRYTLYIGIVMKAVSMLSNELMKLSMTMSTIGQQMRAITATPNTVATPASILATAQQRLAAATTPNAIQVAKATVKPTARDLWDTAQRNINNTHTRNMRGQLISVDTGKFVNEQNLVAEEYSRLKEALKREQASLRKVIVAREAEMKLLASRKELRLADKAIYRKEWAIPRLERIKGKSYEELQMMALMGGRSSAFTKGVGSLAKLTSKALTAIGGVLMSVALLPAVWDVAYQSSKAIADKFKFAESEVIKYFGQGWVGRVAEFLLNGRTAGGTNIDMDAEEAGNASASIAARKKALASLISRAKVEGAISSAEARRLQGIVATTNTEAALQNTLKQVKDARDRYLNSVNGTADQEDALNRQLAEATAAAEQSKKDYMQGKYTPSEKAIAAVTTATTGIDTTGVTTLENQRIAAALMFGADKGVPEQTTPKALIEMRDKFTTDILKEYTAQSDAWKQIVGVTTVEELGKLDIGKDMTATQKDMYLLILKNIREAAKKAKTPEELAAANEANRAQMEKDQKDRAKAASNKARFEANKRIAEITKQSETDMLGADFQRATLLNGQVSPTTMSGIELNRDKNALIAMQSALRSANYSYESRVRQLKNDGFTDEQIKAETETDRTFIAESGKKVAELQDKVAKGAGQYVDATIQDITKSVEDKFRETGLDPTKVTKSLLGAKSAMAGTLERNLKGQLDFVETELSKAYAPADILSLKTQRDRLRKAMQEATVDAVAAQLEEEEYRLAQLSGQKDAGLLSESGYQTGVNAVYGGRISRARKAVDLAGSAYEMNKTTENFNRLQQATEALTSAELEARIATKDFGDLQRKQQESLMGTVQDFASKKDSKGRLTNDALYHSLNLMARMMGPQASAALTNPSIEVMGQPSYKNAEKAQQAVAQSLDAYILSQKYAQATTGKTVQRIYDFISRNNSIVVRG